MHGLYRIVVGGNIGRCNLKLVIGSVTGLQVILSELHVHGGQYNIGGIDTDFKLLGTDFSTLKDTRYQGWFVGGGIAYGYAWILGRHWNIETEIGVGYSYTRYDRFQVCRVWKESGEEQTAQLLWSH